jgi:hypothetical protein
MTPGCRPVTDIGEGESQMVVTAPPTVMVTLKFRAID